MVAIVYHIPLIRILFQMNLAGGVFSLNHFAIGYDCNDVRNERYMVASGEFFISICRNTTFIPLMGDVENGFPFYPLVPSIRTLLEDRSTRKFMIGTSNLFDTFIFLKIKSCLNLIFKL